MVAGSMKLLKISLYALLALISTSLAAQESEIDKPFTLIKDKDHIMVYERWIQFPKSDPPIEAREVKSIFYAKASLEDAVALMKNESKIQNWQSHVSKFKVFPQNDTMWFEYSYHDIPWPVSDQDHFLMYVVKEYIPGEKLFLTFETVKNETLAPIDEDADRMTLAGSWLFEKQPTNLKITYRILSMPSSIPRIFTDPVIRSNLMSTIKGYIQTVEEKQ
jgi:hypothetical protein